jgi:hypothetical protein
MTETEWMLFLACVFLLGTKAIGMLIFRFGSRKIIHQRLEENGTRIKDIKPHTGFLDLGSIWKALTSRGYTISTVSSTGQELDVFCLVRYIPILGFVRSIEVWNDPTERTNT